MMKKLIEKITGVPMTEAKVREIVKQVLQERGLVAYDPAALNKIQAGMK